MLAIVRLKGQQGIKNDMKDVLNMLKLTRPNHCVLLKDTPENRATISKINNFIAWGVINDAVLKKLVAKRGEFNADAKDVEVVLKKLKDGTKPEDIGLNGVFRLHPPSGGHKNVKHIYPYGSLGNWGDEINSLLNRMI